MLRLECGRVQLFNKHFYRLCKGKAIRQFLGYKEGKQYFEDWGSERNIQEIYDQIKLTFDPTGKIVAVRATKRECLVVKTDSVWHRTSLPKPAPLTATEKLIRQYHEDEALNYYRWLRDMHSYSNKKYGQQKQRLRVNAQLMKKYDEEEKEAYHLWLSEIRAYSQKKYGSKIKVIKKSKEVTCLGRI